MISGHSRPQRRHTMPNTAPIAKLPRPAPKPWYRWYAPRSSAGAHQRAGAAHAELAQPGHQVADDDHLLGPAVGERGKDQHRNPPPGVGERGRHHRRTQADDPREQVQAEARDPDQKLPGRYRRAHRRASELAPTRCLRGPMPLRHNRYNASPPHATSCCDRRQVQPEIDQVEVGPPVDQRDLLLAQACATPSRPAAGPR